MIELFSSPFCRTPLSLAARPRAVNPLYSLDYGYSHASCSLCLRYTLLPEPFHGIIAARLDGLSTDENEPPTGRRVMGNGMGWEPCPRFWRRDRSETDDLLRPSNAKQ